MYGGQGMRGSARADIRTLCCKKKHWIFQKLYVHTREGGLEAVWTGQGRGGQFCKCLLWTAL